MIRRRPALRPAPLLRALLAALCAGTATEAQQVATVDVTALSPTTLTAITPGGGTVTDTLAAGPLSAGSANRSAISSDPSQTALTTLTVSNYVVFTRLTARAEVDAGSPQAHASTIPIDILVDFSFNAPAYPELVLKTYSAQVGPSGTAAMTLDVDVGNDGVVDHSITPMTCQTPSCVSSQPDWTLPISLPTTSVAVRFTGAVFAGPGEFANVDVDLHFGTAPGPCTAATAALPCGGPSGASGIFSAVHRVDHALVLRRLASPQGPPPLLVIGFSQLNALLPIPSAGGIFCPLHPFPDIVVPMAPANPPVITGFAYDVIIPPFTATTPLPFTFWAQSITLGAGAQAVPDLSQAIRFDCQ